MSMQPKHGRRIVVAIMIAVTAPLATGQTIHKCRTPDGRTVYQQIACSPGSRATGVLVAPAAPNPEDQYAAQMRLQRDQQYFRQQEEAEAARVRQSEYREIERRRVEIEEKDSAFRREQVTRNTGKRLETRSRAEWIESDKAQAQSRANRSARRPMTCIPIGPNFHCN